MVMAPWAAPLGMRPSAAVFGAFFRRTVAALRSPSLASDIDRPVELVKSLLLKMAQLKMAIEIVDFPINSMVIFHSKMWQFTRG